MNFIQNHYGKVALVIAAIFVIFIGLAFSPKENKGLGTAAPSGSISFFTGLASQYGYYVGTYGSNTQIIDELGNFIATTLSFIGLPTFDGGLTMSYTNSTSTTATTQTLSASDITNYTSVIFTPNTNSVTLTLPASSTLAAFVPVAGDWAQQCWQNATTVAAKNITFAAGTGIDLEVSSSSLVIAPGNSGCFRFLRKPATASTFDIIAQFTAFVDGD